MILTGCTFSLAGIAAPTTESAPVTEPNPVSTLTLGTAVGARPAERNSDVRTIDMLVDMQQTGAGIQFNERPSRGASVRDGQARAAAGAPAAAALRQDPTPATASGQRTQVESPATPPSGLFGSGAVPALQGRSQAGAADSPAADGPGRAAAAGRPQSELPPELKRWLHGPRELVEYVRQNRALVVACTAMLLLLAWAGSMMFSRRRS